ncbi:Protein trichome birefringence-like 25 [Vigna angularis]|uniref:Protein trichome birefringence-like 25 n=1 Tax=Phaseolus angularis TaxID=3914 RepID=A0A8T0K6K8_PHAAN|nr:Protein trichome birefringence-like 25 [Vigna angularis]
MTKETRSNSNPLFAQKHNYHHHRFFLKLAVSCLLVGLTVRLLFTDSFSLSSVVHNPPPLANAIPNSPFLSFPPPPPPSYSADFPVNQTQASPQDWVPDLNGPRYTNESCRVIQDHQNCMKNGRPDSGYLYWRWNPRGCELPKFSPRKFLDMMRDKSWAFIGDSISRNHVQSLLCLLSQVCVADLLLYQLAAHDLCVVQVEAADAVYHDEEYKSRIWKFPSHNFTLSTLWSPFLVKADIFEDINGVSSSEPQLYLDVVDDKWTSQYKNFDYVVIAGGKWFLKTAIYHENNTVTGCYKCHGKNLTDQGFQHAYSKALQQAFDFMTHSEHKPVVFFRTTTPDHFEYGEWFSGGYCNRTLPFKEEQIHVRYEDSVLRSIELEEFDRAKNASPNFKLLDTTGLSLLRPDGHPGPYRYFHPLLNSTVQNDCLHWCLPGPIDSWNDILLQMLII